MKQMTVMVGTLLAMVCRLAAGDEPQIAVTAEATTLARPNQAVLSLTVTAAANDSEKAVAEMKKRTEAAKVVIGKYLSKDGQIEKSELEINADMSESGKRSVKEGYYAKIHLSFLLLNLAQYEEVAGKLSQLDGVELAKPVYGRTDAQQLQKETLKKALANAQDKGKFIADTLGVKLGSPIFAEETGEYYRHRGGNMAFNLNGNEPYMQQPEGSEEVDALDNVQFQSNVKVRFRIDK